MSQGHKKYILLPIAFLFLININYSLSADSNREEDKSKKSTQFDKFEYLANSYIGKKIKITTRKDKYIFHGKVIEVDQSSITMKTQLGSLKINFEDISNLSLIEDKKSWQNKIVYGLVFVSSFLATVFLEDKL